MARAWGLPRFPIPRNAAPIANLNDAELDARAEAIVPEVVKLLLERNELADMSGLSLRYANPRKGGTEGTMGFPLFVGR